MEDAHGAIAGDEVARTDAAPVMILIGRGKHYEVGGRSGAQAQALRGNFGVEMGVGAIGEETDEDGCFQIVRAGEVRKKRRIVGDKRGTAVALQLPGLPREDLVSAQAPCKDGLLNVQAVFGFVEHDGLGAVDHVG